MVNNRLREIREKREIRLIDLATGIGVTRQTIHAIETKKYTPSLEVALKVSKYLKLNVEDVFTLSKAQRA